MAPGAGTRCPRLTLRLLLRRVDVTRTERGLRWAQLASSAAVSVGHGGNDAQKTMGVVAALLVSTGHPTQTGDKLPIPLWVAVLAASVIALGTLSGGWRIVRTMGLRITRLRPVSGFSAETGAAIALFGSTPIGAPVSTTHTVAGAVSGVGTANRGTTTNWSVFGRMAVAWLVTMPFAGLVGYLVWHLAMLSNRPASVVIMTVIVVGLVAILAVAIRPTSRSDAFRPDRKPEKVPSRLPPPADHVLRRAVDGVRRAALTAG